MVNDKEQIKYPVGVQSFEKLRTEGFVYVDKTMYVHRLITTGGYYFLSRPRRFGKSLLLSTIEAYYKGRRDLFEGLALNSLTDDWEPHPILHLDLNNRQYKDESSLIAELNAHLEEWEAVYGNEKRHRAPEERFAYVIRRACEITGKKVVILVDEYDKPLLNAIDNPELAENYRSLLKTFYSNLKTMDAYIQLGFLTGVARFSKVSIFSDLNNLRDISFVDEYSAICGVTTEELNRYFRAGIEGLTKKLHISYAETLERLRLNYDGYHFSTESPDIYNPFGLMNVFANRKISAYWSNSGTPEFLVRLIKRDDWNISALAPTKIEVRKLESAGVTSTNPTPVLYQAGYLTIKGYDDEFDEYLLDYPNQEVRKSFWEDLVPTYLYSDSNQGSFSIREFISDVRNGNADAFMHRLETLIAGVPYSEKGSAEAHFQNAIYLLFNLMGFYCKMEERTSNGRIDLLLETDRFIFIIEFKIDSTPKAAMDQILQRQYWLPYRLAGKKIIMIGANFDSNTLQLSDNPIIRPLDIED